MAAEGDGGGEACEAGAYDGDLEGSGLWRGGVEPI